MKYNMRFGISKELITPDYPTHMIGYAEYYRKYYQSVHDDLFVRCFLLDDGNKTALMISFDLLFHDFEFTEKVREYAAEKYGLDRSAVILSYTHTHYGPAVKGYSSELADDNYEDFLFERTKHCINKVFLNTFEGTLSFGVLFADESINRRKPVNGEYIMAPNLEGAKDTDLTVFVARDNNEKIRAIAVSYACHPNIRRDVMELSGEYPGRLCQLLEAKYYGAQAIFFQGFGADTRARITADYTQFAPRTSDDIDDMANSLAEKIERAIVRKGALKEISLSLKTSVFTVKCPLEPFPKEYFENDAINNPYHAIRVCARFVADNYHRLPSECTVHGGVWEFCSDVILIYLGGEICYSTKQVLMREFPDKQIILIGYADSTAYIPSDKIIAEGGYEHEGSVIEYRLKGKFKPGVDKLMINAVKECLNII